MNYFITGATGFVGIHLINLLQRDEKVKRIYILVRDQNKLDKRLTNKNKVYVIEGNLFNFKEIPQDVNYIIHLAGLTKTYKKENYYLINRDGVKSIIEKALELKNLEKFVLVSSLAARGPSLECEIENKEIITHPVSNYGKSKLAGEKEALKHKGKIDIVILRPPAVYGQWDFDFLEEFKMLKKGISLNVKHKPSERFVSLVNVEDLVKAVRFFSEKKTVSGDIFCIAEQKKYSWEEVEKISSSLLGKKIKLKITLPLWIGYIIALFLTLLARLSKKGYIFNLDKINEIKYKCWTCSSEKAKKHGFVTEMKFEDSLKKVFDWYKEKGLL